MFQTTNQFEVRLGKRIPKSIIPAWSYSIPALVCRVAIKSVASNSPWRQYNSQSQHITTHQPWAIFWSHSTECTRRSKIEWWFGSRNSWDSHRAQGYRTLTPVLSTADFSGSLFNWQLRGIDSICKRTQKPDQVGCIYPHHTMKRLINAIA